MKEGTIKLKKGGIDTIVAYIVVMLPLLYVVVYMVATIYHFSVQTYMNQVVKEATMMASTYGKVTQDHADYITGKLADILGEHGCTIEYYKKEFNTSTGVVGTLNGPYASPTEMGEVGKADIIGIYVQSVDNSILDSVTSFNVFGGDDIEQGLKYSAYREEIVRNERP